MDPGADNQAMVSEPDSWSLPFFALMISAWLLFKLVCTLIFVGMMTFFVCIGPAVSLTGYVAIVNRLGHHPLVQDSWVYLMRTRRTIEVLNAYVETYAIDMDVALTVGGILMTLPAWYVATKVAPILMTLLGLDRLF
jgi:hypothetical protein